MLKNYVLIGVGLLCCASLVAQKEEKPLRIGLGLSGITYLGDLNEPGLGVWRVHAGGELSLERVSHNWFGVSFHAGFGKFTEQWDQPDNQPGTRFVQTPFLHGDFRVHARASKGKVQPYASLGAGLLSFTPTDRDGIPLDEGDYHTIIPQLPVSAGLRWQVNDQIGFDAFYTWRFTPSDFLDNIGSDGVRSGFDAIHAISVAFQFDLKNTKQDPAPLPAAVPLPDADSATAVQQEGQRPSPVESRPEASAIEEDLYDREQALQSVEDNIFLYYESKAGETLEELSARFRVPPDLLRELNFLPEETILRKGTYLRIPHVEHR